MDRSITVGDLTFPAIIHLSSIDDSHRLFHVPQYCDLFIGPHLTPGEKYRYKFNDVYIHSNEPIKCYALGFCNITLETELPHPDGILGEYDVCERSEEPIFERNDSESYVYRNGTLDKLEQITT
jgi:hypothetical protein